MRKRVLVAAASVLALAACTSVPRLAWVGGTGDFSIQVKPDPKEVVVYVDERRVLVDQEPVYAKNDPDTESKPDNEKKKKIVWKLDHGYAFPATNGIEICPSTPAAKACATAPEDLACTRDNDRKITCRYKVPPRDKIYFYTIRVMDGSSTLVLDPSIMN